MTKSKISRTKLRVWKNIEGISLKLFKKQIRAKDMTWEDLLKRKTRAESTNKVYFVTKYSTVAEKMYIII